jgi:hypothetical protein
MDRAYFEQISRKATAWREAVRRDGWLELALGEQIDQSSIGAGT